MFYLLFLLPGMLLVWWAQQRVQGTYNKYSEVQSSMGMTGAEVAKTILKRMGVSHVSVEPVAGVLSDIMTRVLKLFGFRRGFMARLLWRLRLWRPMNVVTFCKMWKVIRL